MVHNKIFPYLDQVSPKSSVSFLEGPFFREERVTRGGHIYTCCTDTRDRDQSEIKRSIGDDQAIKMSVCTAQIKVKTGPVL